MRRVKWLFLLAVAINAQKLEFGVKGGWRLTEDQPGFGGIPNQNESKSYIVGPQVAIGLPRGLVLEFDGLYSRVGFRERSGFKNTHLTTTRYRGHSWEFPILGRKTLGPVYAGGGYSARVIRGSGHQDITAPDPATGAPTYREDTAPNPWRATQGVVLLFGSQRRWRRLNIGPELRFTRWFHPAANYVGGTQNQVQVLVGISF
jgi:hypothetical protein